jgi:predicted dehydrogenase
MKKVNVALIGIGNHGTKWAYVIPRIASLCAVVDKRIENSPTIEDVLKDSSVDVVVIVTPHKDLAELTTRCLRAGKHVLCEKPGAINPEDIKKNIELAKKKKLSYKVGYNYRYHDAFYKAKKLCDKEVIGKILFIRASHGFGGRKGYNKEWRLDKKISGGGHLHDQGVHLIDMVQYFIGKIEKVQGMIKDTFWGAKAEDNAFVLLQGKNAMASIHSSLTQWKSLMKFEIFGSDGYLIIEGLGDKYGGGYFGPNLGERLIVGKRSKDFTGLSKEKVIKCKPDDSLYSEFKEFIGSVVNKKPLMSQDPYNTLNIVEEVYKQNA